MAEEENQEKNRRKPGTFPPGVSGNKKGHPLGVPNYRANFRRKLEQFSTWKAPDAIIQQIRNALPKITNQATIDDIEAARIHLAAMMGESWAIERLHGKSDQAIDLTTLGKEIKAAPTFILSNKEDISNIQSVIKRENSKNADLPTD